ncbi:unnamed protein product [Danaus chrysippus]|uniref:(African queen) hypothetical protein n=1 Tax=Danaus chrysippus TaxID=151541 RepID=A0A8J2VQ86_9NEOP|nr:unnamed protein product [Danaus chrysippus]
MIARSNICDEAAAPRRDNNHVIRIDGKLSGGEMCASQNILAVSPTKGIRRKKRSVPFALALTNNATRICYPNTSSI